MKTIIEILSILYAVIKNFVGILISAICTALFLVIGLVMSILFIANLFGAGLDLTIGMYVMSAFFILCITCWSYYKLVL